MAQTAKGSMGKTPSKATFVKGEYGDKDPMGGYIKKGKDLRGLPGRNEGKMPRKMTS
jgi:hypothetical protein